MESERGSGSSKHSQTPPDVTVHEDDLLGLEKQSDLSSSSSSLSSSSDSFDENFFLVDESGTRKSNVGTIDLLEHDKDTHLAVRESEKEVSRDISHELVASNLESPGLTAPTGDLILTPESSSSSGSAKQSPQIQVMERPEEPDLYRIPSTVFTRTKSTAPVEWSVASNESLFSIHMGNNSFSRDQIFLLGKSQELGRSEDMFKFPNTTAGEINNFSNSPLTVAEVANPDKKSSGLSQSLGVDVAAETMKEILRENAEERKKGKRSSEGVRRSSCTSHHSDGSGASVISFAFPILTKEGTKSGSVKVEPEQQRQQHHQQTQPQTPGANPNASGINWFCCFSCSLCR